MIIIRKWTRLFSSSGDNVVTSKDILIEQMKQQRQLMQTIRLKDKLRAEERKERMRSLQKIQKAKQEEDERIVKSITKAAEESTNNSEGIKARAISLYKSRSTPVPPVSMSN